MILECMIKSPNTNSYFDQDSLRDHLFPELNRDQVKELLLEIINSKPSLLRVFKESSNGRIPVQPTGLVKHFLEEGGFTKLESETKSKIDFSNTKELLELELTKLSIKVAELNAENLKLQNRQLKRYVWYSIIGFIAGAAITNVKGIISLIRELF